MPRRARVFVEEGFFWVYNCERKEAARLLAALVL
jgi:hypothetical protein